MAPIAINVKDAIGDFAAASPKKIHIHGKDR